MLKAIILLFLTVVVFCVVCLVAAASVKAETIVVEIEGLEVEDLVVKGFELTQKSEVEITAVVIRDPTPDDYVFFVSATVGVTNVSQLTTQSTGGIAPRSTAEVNLSVNLPSATNFLIGGIPTRATQVLESHSHTALV